MRLVLVVPGGVGADGVHEVIPAILSLLSLLRSLTARHEVLVVAAEQVASPPAYELAGARVIALGRLRRERLGRIRAAGRTISAIRAFRPDVIHAVWLPATDGSFRLLVAASINRVKGPDVTLEALARARRTLGNGVDLRLEWLGEDTLGGSTAALARALGIADVVGLRGFRPHWLILDAWRNADLAIQGSYHESQGVAALEAAMAGVPAVGTAVGLVAELAADPPAAIAVPVGNAAALGDAIVALAHDPERRARLGEAARAWALAHDAWTAASFEAIYAEVTAVRRSRA